MKNIYKALSDFQQEVPTISKNATGYGYKFADLEEITNVIKPLLKKHGLGYTQPINGTQVKTTLFHVDSGETIEAFADIPQGVELKGQNDFQVMGSAITYLRRYSLSSLLGLVTDEDNDATGSQTSYKAATSPQATQKQLDFIRSLAKQQGVSDELIETRLADIKTVQQAKDAIDKLQGSK